MLVLHYPFRPTPARQLYTGLRFYESCAMAYSETARASCPGRCRGLRSVWAIGAYGRDVTPRDWAGADRAGNLAVADMLDAGDQCRWWRGGRG